MRLRALLAVAALATVAAPHGTSRADTQEHLVPAYEEIQIIQTVTLIRLVRSGTPESTPTPTPEPIQDPWPAQLNAEQMVEVLMLAGWPEHLWGQASAIAWCESTWQPGAVGDNGDSLGLFQIQPQFHNHRINGDWFDPVANAEAALHLYREQGWDPWSCARVL
jgi:hypothetical protein